MNNNISQKLTTAKRSLITEIKGTNKVTCETTEIGKNVLSKLSEQSALIRKNDENLEDNNYFLSKTIRILRSMTWFGWIFNFFTRKPSEPEKKEQKKQSDDIYKKENEKKEKKIELLENEFKCLIESDDVDKKNEDTELSNLESEIKNLHFISLKIGEYLDIHNKELTEMATKTEDVIIKTKDATEREENLV